MTRKAVGGRRTCGPPSPWRRAGRDVNGRGVYGFTATTRRAAHKVRAARANANAADLAPTLAYLYARENEDEARAKTLTADQARRIARNIARLPELLGKAED
jgi:hypothetical protein